LRNTLVIILLAVAAAASWLWSLRPPAERDQRPSNGSSEPLGYYLHGARLLGTDDNGRIAYRISADRLTEMPERQILRLDGVHIAYQPADETPWIITAASGNAPKDGSRLDLEGDVEVRSEPTDGSKPVVISAGRLTFEPETSTAESDVAVQIRVGDWHLDAVGLRTRLNDDTLELESEVHGKFAP
jgi:lipopolysaccharide export system protein LptC